MHIASKEKRDKSVSIAKGIAIILMVLGHADGPGTRWLQMIRMPLFFFMSGYCFKDKYLDEAKSFIRKRITGIYWPYIKWSIAFLCFHNVFIRLSVYDTITPFNGHTQIVYTGSDYIHHLIQIITSMDGHDVLLSPLWFLKTLLVGSLLFFAVRKMTNNQVVGILVLLSFTLLTSLFNLKLPYFNVGSKEFLAATYMMAGHYYKIKKWSFESNWLFLCISIITIAVIGWFWHTSMLHYKFEDIIPLFFLSLTGTLVLFGVSRKVMTYLPGASKVLTYIGNNTFKVMAMHPISFKVVSLMIIALFGLPMERLAETYTVSEFALKGFWLLYAVFGVGIPVMTAKIIEMIKNKDNA